MNAIKSSIYDVEEKVRQLETLTSLFMLVNNSVESEEVDFLVKLLQKEVNSLRDWHTQAFQAQDCEVSA